MGGIFERNISKNRENNQLKIIRWLVYARATTGYRSPHFWLILALLAAVTYIYYGILTDYFDIYLIIFCYPVIYAAVVYRLRGAVVSIVAVLGILLPHVLQFDYDAYSMLRILFFMVFAFLIGCFGATLLNYLERQLEAYDEIVSLNEELNDNIEHLKITQKQLVQAEKISAIGQLAASVAHEINNPLGGILVYSKLLIKRIKGGSFDNLEIVGILEKVESAVSHCSYIIKSLLDFSRQSEPELETVRLDNIINEVITLARHKAEMNKVKVSISDMSFLPEISADAKQLQQVFLNIFVNAVQAMPQGGELNIDGSIDDDGWVRVSVSDTGYGIAPENMDRLFTPFFTTKAKENGTGLGLAVSHGIIERHEGRIEVQSSDGKGSIFTVCLPSIKNRVNQSGVSP